MDPLSVLRDYAIRNDLSSITRVNDEIRFGTTHTFRATTPIAYRSKHGHHLTLETLIYFLSHSHLKHTDYLKSVKSLAIPYVSLVDRKPLLGLVPVEQIDESVKQIRDSLDSLLIC